MRCETQGISAAVNDTDALMAHVLLDAAEAGDLVVFWIEGHREEQAGALHGLNAIRELVGQSSELVEDLDATLSDVGAQIIVESLEHGTGNVQGSWVGGHRVPVHAGLVNLAAIFVQGRGR